MREIAVPFGVIGENVEILDAMHIVNVNIGPYSKIKGVSRLRNGSINSCKEDPVFIGMNVIADDFRFIYIVAGENRRLLTRDGTTRE